MENDNNEIFFIEIMKEVDQEWFKFRDKLKKGYAVFYSPPRINPELMIIGFNPGGDEKAFNRCRENKFPQGHEYLKENYPMAKKMKELFKNMGTLELLQNSVKLNLIFFRSKATDEWKAIEKTTRNHLEEFCLNKVEYIIMKLEPKFILAEGILTYRILKNRIFSGKDYIEENPFGESKNLLLTTKFNDPDIRLIGIRHPTGKWTKPSKEEWDKIGNYLLNLIK
jgi:hypothetical protein